MKIKISKNEIMQFFNIDDQKLKTYEAPIINLANTYAWGTRPAIVGQMSELIQQFQGKTIVEWEEWYSQQKPMAIKTATEIIYQKLQLFKSIIEKIDQKTVEKWVRDLVITKTFTGLKFQEVILKKAADLKKEKYRLALPEEESKGIDGFVGNIPISIKPDTYRLKASLPEEINLKIIYYSKKKDGIEVDFKEIM